MHCSVSLNSISVFSSACIRLNGFDYLRLDDSWRRPSFFDKRCAEDWLCGISVCQLRWKKVVKFMLIWQVGILMNPLFKTFQLLIELWGKFAWKTSVLKMVNIQWMYLPAHWKGDSGLEERLVHFRTPLGYFSIPMTPSHYSDTLGQGIQKKTFGPFQSGVFNNNTSKITNVCYYHRNSIVVNSNIYCNTMGCSYIYVILDVE